MQTHRKRVLKAVAILGLLPLIRTLHLGEFSPMEPVSSDNLEGLHLLRDRAPAGMEIAAGGYRYIVFYFDQMLRAGALDVLQADATCSGISGIIRVDALCEALVFRCPRTLHRFCIFMRDAH